MAIRYLLTVSQAMSFPKYYKRRGHQKSGMKFW